ncbi:hypothetical protein [Oceaniferula spumae]
MLIAGNNFTSALGLVLLQYEGIGTCCMVVLCCLRRHVILAF